MKYIKEGLVPLLFITYWIVVISMLLGCEDKPEAICYTIDKVSVTDDGKYKILVSNGFGIIDTIPYNQPYDGCFEIEY